MLPSAQLVRFGTTGSEMVQVAVRAARAHTGTNKGISEACGLRGEPGSCPRLTPRADEQKTLAAAEEVLG
jgi:4-aminobutyrate aminotransferase-like enzyme